MGSPARSNPTARRGRNYLGFQNFHEHSDATVHTLDETQYSEGEVKDARHHGNQLSRIPREAMSRSEIDH